MILAIDIGNTNIVIGVFKDDALVASWRLSTVRHRTPDEIGLQLHELFGVKELRFADITDVIISSVVPPLVDAMVRFSQEYLRLEPLLVGPGTRTGMPILYEDPREVGADRIVNAVAAYKLYGGPVIAVDFGTATTFDAITAKGEYLGGAIAPGIQISCDALFNHAARLPRIELVAPPAAIGRNTVSSMQSGIIFGYVGLVREMVTRFRRELEADAKVIATGGLAELIARHTDIIDEVNPLLTLTGLIEIHRRARRRGEGGG